MTALTGVLLPALAADRTNPDGRKSKRGIKRGPAKGPDGRVNNGMKAVVMTDTKWQRFIGDVSSGVTLRKAMKMHGVGPASLEGRLRTDKKSKAQLDEAKVLALRIHWDDQTLEDVLVAIAMGATVKAACEDALMGGRVDTFYRLIMRDQQIREAYDEARMIQAEKMAIDDVIEISDNMELDETWDGRGNSAAVNRSRLMVDSRKWIAARLHHQRFGDKIQQDVNMNVVVDHAARLEAARKRKESAHAERKKQSTK